MFLPAENTRGATADADTTERNVTQCTTQRARLYSHWIRERERERERERKRELSSFDKSSNGAHESRYGDGNEC